MPVLVIAHSKGGCGKTTTAYNVVCELQPSLVIDLDVHKGISILNAMRAEPGPLNIVAPEGVPDMLALVREYDEAGKTVVIDCGGFDSDSTRAAVAIADLVIVPAADTPTERIGLSVFDATLADISKATKQDIQAKLVICKTHPSRKHFPKMDILLPNMKHITRLESVISHRPDHYESHEFGRGVTELVATRHSAAGKEITSLVAEINELLGVAA